MSDILARISRFLEAEEISPRSFSLSIGKSAAYFSNSIKKGSSPSGDLLATIVDIYPNLNLRWVLLGEGKMTIESEFAAEPGLKYKKEGSIDRIIDEKIDTKLERFSEVIKEIIAGQIDEEIQRTREEISEKEKKT